MDYRIETLQKVKIQNVVETNYDTCKNVQLYMYIYDIKKITCPLPKKQDNLAFKYVEKSRIIENYPKIPLIYVQVVLVNPFN